MPFDVVGTDLVKNFDTEGGGTHVALRKVGFEVEQGHFFVIVGDSGSGKTTLLRSVAGLERPNEGEIQLRGKTVFSARQGLFVSPQDRGIGMVFQSYAIWPHLTVYDNVALPLREGRNRLAREEVRKRVSDALETVGLVELADRPAPNLSGGQQQRVALARAIAVSSSLLLMDEPMSNLDARLREEVRTQIKSVAKHYNTTVLYVTHDQVEAMALADQMALMRHGDILQRGTPEELYDRSASIEVAEFFGPMNLVDGELVGSGEVRTRFGLLKASAKNDADKHVLVGLRPEKVRLGLAAAEGANRFSAKVTDRVFLGGSNVYEIDCGGVKFRVDAIAALQVGDTVDIQLPQDALRIFPHRHGAQGRPDRGAQHP